MIDLLYHNLLNKLMDKHGAGNGWDDFISADLASQDDGTIHAIPWTVDTFAMVYRRDHARVVRTVVLP